VGSKDWSGDPAALFHGLSKTDKKFITVSSNYRLGGLGWTSAPGQDMVPNVGIWDALAALEWTQQYIRFFGGDSERITVMGESAGGGIIDHLITAHGGAGTVSFQQVRENRTYLPPFYTKFSNQEKGNFDLTRIQSTCEQFKSDDGSVQQLLTGHELYHNLLPSQHS
jgi:hypothetical protein